MTFNTQSQRAVFLASIMFATNVGNALEPLSQLGPEYKITIGKFGIITIVTPSGRVITDSGDSFQIPNTSNKLSTRNYYRTREEVPTEEEFLAQKEKDLRDYEESNIMAKKKWTIPSPN